MTRNECIEQCVTIWNNTSITTEDKEEKIRQLLLNSEKTFGKSSVRKFLNILKSKEIPVTEIDLWNQIRD